MAVADRLQTRGLAVNPICKLCNQNIENTCHVLFGCLTTQSQLELAQIPAPTNVFSDSLEDNFTYVLDLMEQSDIPETVGITIPWVLWSIWKNMNAILYAGTQEVLETVVDRAKDEATLWQKVNNCQPVKISSSMMYNGIRERWHAPSPGTVKCNIHANWRNEHLHSGVSWLVRNYSGLILHHAGDAFTRSNNRIHAELRCILWALQSLKDLRYMDVTISTDCHSTVEALSKPFVWPRYYGLTTQISKLRSLFDNCEIEEEHPGANSIAREIAKSVTRDGRFQLYLVLDDPLWLYDRIIRESR